MIAHHSNPRKLWRLLVPLLIILLISALVMPSLTSTAQAKKIMTIGREGVTTFTRNFNPFSPNAIWGTTTAIYERMIMHNRAKDEIVPWLATEYKWGNDGKTLTFTLRSGVKWSDGQPFSAKDVAFTFALLKKSFAGGGYDYVDKVEAVNDTTVQFTFNRAFSPALHRVGQQIIVPEHIWSKIDDPVKFTNPDPVGTGPFTQVAVFQPQVFELHRNPNYWQPGKPYIDGIRYPAYPANEQVSVALIGGEIDWADIFQPDVQKTFVDRDPAHNYYWFPTLANTIQLTMNTTRKPFDDPTVRKAISMAINRDQVTKIAMSGYTHPADVTGLSDGLASWKSPEALKAGDWTTRNVEKANQMLDAAGYKRGADGIRTLPDGKPMKYQILVGASSSDWVSSSQIIAQGLKEIGLDVTVGAREWGGIIEQKQKGDFDLAHSWTGLGPTPYEFYRWEMSCDVVKPVGEVTNENFHRYCNKEATELLHQFETTFDTAKQKEIVNKLQLIFVENAPGAVLFPSPQWGEVNTTRFTGFPNADNPYALLESRETTAVMVLTTVKPR